MEKMEYNIISGNVVETRRCWMPSKGQRKVRGQKVAGNTSEKKIAANEREAVRKLGRILNTNFAEGDCLFVTLKYSEERLPEDYEQARKNAKIFLGKVKRKDPNMEYVMVTANWSPRRDRPARLHHHMVIRAESMDLLSKLWPEGEFNVERIRPGQDLTQLAAYLVANTHDLKAGIKKWTTSQGLQKPIYTEPKPVQDLAIQEPLPNAVVCEWTNVSNEDGFIDGSYMRQILPERVKVRGSMIILPKRGKKKYKVPKDISQMAQYDE